MYTFLYKVKCYLDNGKEDERCGIVIADSFQQATRQIEAYFGDDMVGLQMEVYDTSLFTLDACYYEVLKKELEEYF